MTTEVAIRDEQPVERQAIGLANPVEVLEMAAKQATALAQVIEKRRLFTMIGNKKHVSVEGWQTLGALNQLQAFTESVTVSKGEDGAIEANAVVSARRVTDGVAIAQAEGFCSTHESRWKGRDEYAVRSMAQTRATSKVFRQALAWVMVLAGYEATPLEEVPHTTVQEAPQIDEETRALIEQHVILDAANLAKAKPWLKAHGYLTPATLYRKISNEDAAALLDIVGFTFGGGTDGKV